MWPSKLIGELLPRHLEIIEKIQDQFAAELKAKGVDEATIKDMAIYTGDSVRMAYLATYGGSHVNGVAELHSQLLKDVTLKNFSDVYPDKFTNVTNGVTPRRFIKLANPRLSDVITEGLGTDKWLSDLELLKGSSRWPTMTSSSRSSPPSSRPTRSTSPTSPSASTASTSTRTP